LFITENIKKTEGNMEEKSLNDKQQIKAVLSEVLPLKIDELHSFIVGDWAFCDALEYEDGSISATMGAIVHKEGNTWRMLAKGRPLDDEWDKVVETLPPDIRKDYEDWRISHM
jgi:hypothetical protein